MALPGSGWTVTKTHFFFRARCLAGLRCRTISQLQNQSEGVPMNDKGRRALLMGGAAASLQLPMVVESVDQEVPLLW